MLSNKIIRNKTSILILFSILILSSNSFANNDEYLKSSLKELTLWEESPELENITRSTSYECTPTIKNLNVAAPPIKISVFQHKDYDLVDLEEEALSEQQQKQSFDFEKLRNQKLGDDAFKELVKNGELPDNPGPSASMREITLYVTSVQLLISKKMKELQNKRGLTVPARDYIHRENGKKDQILIDGTIIHNFNKKPSVILDVVSDKNHPNHRKSFKGGYKKTLEFLNLRIPDAIANLLSIENKNIGGFFSKSGPFRNSRDMGPKVDFEKLESGFSYNNFVVTPKFEVEHPDEFKVQFYFGVHEFIHEFFNKWSIDQLATYKDISTPEFHEYLCNKQAEKESEKESEAVLSEWIKNSLPLGGEPDSDLNFSNDQNILQPMAINNFMSYWLLLSNVQKSELLNRAADKIEAMDRKKIATVGAITIAGAWASVKMVSKRIPLLGLAAVATSAQAVPNNCISNNLMPNLVNLSSVDLKICLDSFPAFKKELAILIDEASTNNYEELK